MPKIATHKTVRSGSSQFLNLPFIICKYPRTVWDKCAYTHTALFDGLIVKIKWPLLSPPVKLPGLCSIHDIFCQVEKLF